MPHPTASELARRHKNAILEEAERRRRKGGAQATSAVSVSGGVKRDTRLYRAQQALGAVLNRPDFAPALSADEWRQLQNAATLLADLSGEDTSSNTAIYAARKIAGKIAGLETR